MSLSKALDIESVRFAAPDLDHMRRFLLDFGLVDAEDGGDGILRMRGTGNAPFIHETQQGEPCYVSCSLRLGSVEELERLAKAEDTEVRAHAAPGGGFVTSLRDPDGFLVHVIAGGNRVAERPAGVRDPWNRIGARDREGTVKRITAGPAHVARLGHVVLAVSDIQATWSWWQSRFGLIVSDEVRTPEGQTISLFIRCDRGELAVDHHTLNFATLPGVPPMFHHAAFEVADLDDLMAGNQHLIAKDYTHDWGVGRHVLGSQVFDYWKDPWGHRVEHWTDGDLLNASAPTGIADIPTMLGRQWGPESPPDFAG